MPQTHQTDHNHATDRARKPPSIPQNASPLPALDQAVHAALIAPERLNPPALHQIQRVAGNRAALQAVGRRASAGDRSEAVIRRRWSPPRLQSYLTTAAQVVANDPTVFTRYVLQATNPLQEGVGTFVDVNGPLYGGSEETAAG